MKIGESYGVTLSVFCSVCHVFLPLVSIFGLFPVLVKCDYQLNLIQLCLSHCRWLSRVFIVLSVQFDFIWTTRYSPVFLLVSALPCPFPAVSCLSTLKTVISNLFLVHPCCVHREIMLLLWCLLMLQSSSAHWFELHEKIKTFIFLEI